MKKYMFLLIALLITSVFVMADETRYINALKNCSSYSESGSVSSDGVTANSTKQVKGWQGDKCTYVENVNFGGITANVTCKFTKPQLQEITSVMDAYLLTLKYSEEHVDTSSVEAVQNNPIVKVWNKYIQDSNVCTIEAQ